MSPSLRLPGDNPVTIEGHGMDLVGSDSVALSVPSVYLYDEKAAREKASSSSGWHEETWNG